jgi:myo-inositol-1(or 4)-monophosphatase
MPMHCRSSEYTAPVDHEAQAKSAQDDLQYASELKRVVEIAHLAGALVARHFREGTETWEKSKDNPVTQADLDADELIRGALQSSYPEDGLLTEESRDDGLRLERSRTWIVDPIDGTREFSKGIPEFAVSIALVVGGEPVVGVVHNPIEEFTAWAQLGGGTFKSRGDSIKAQRCRVTGCETLADARVLGSRSEDKRGMIDPYRDWFGELVTMGSIAWKLALIATGAADFNLSLKPKNEWDVCAGDLLVREAGGRYLDLAGEPLQYNRPDPLREEPMISGSPALIEEFLRRHSEIKS